MRDCSTLGVCQDRAIRCTGCLPSLRDGQKEETQWCVPHELLGLLYALGIERTPQQATGSGHAGGDCEISTFPWPGAGFGIRAPGVNETPLSVSEAHVAFREGVR